MVTHLFQLGQRGKHQTLALDTVGFFERLAGFLHHGSVKRGLFPSKRTEHFHFQFVR